MFFKISRGIAKLLLGSAAALILVAMVLFALACWVTILPYRRQQSAQIKLALEAMADLGALWRLRGEAGRGNVADTPR